MTPSCQSTGLLPRTKQTHSLRAKTWQRRFQSRTPQSRSQRPLLAKRENYKPWAPERGSCGQNEVHSLSTRLCSTAGYNDNLSSTPAVCLLRGFGIHHRCSLSRCQRQQLFDRQTTKRESFTLTLESISITHFRVVAGKTAKTVGRLAVNVVKLSPC